MIDDHTHVWAGWKEELLTLEKLLERMDELKMEKF